MLKQLPLNSMLPRCFQERLAVCTVASCRQSQNHLSRHPTSRCSEQACTMLQPVAERSSAGTCETYVTQCLCYTIVMPTAPVTDKICRSAEASLARGQQAGWQSDLPAQDVEWIKVEKKTSAAQRVLQAQVLVTARKSRKKQVQTALPSVHQAAANASKHTAAHAEQKPAGSAISQRLHRHGNHTLSLAAGGLGTASDRQSAHTLNPLCPHEQQPLNKDRAQVQHAALLESQQADWQHSSDVVTSEKACGTLSAVLGNAGCLFTGIMGTANAMSDDSTGNAGINSTLMLPAKSKGKTQAAEPHYGGVLTASPRYAESSSNDNLTAAQQAEADMLQLPAADRIAWIETQLEADELCCPLTLVSCRDKPHCTIYCLILLRHSTVDGFVVADR